jgi:hypothetical protein
MRADALRDQQLIAYRKSCHRRGWTRPSVTAVTYPCSFHSSAIAWQPGQFTWHESVQSGAQTMRQNHFIAMDTLAPIFGAEAAAHLYPG